MYETLITKRGQELIAKTLSSESQINLKEAKFSDYAGEINASMNALVSIKHIQSLNNISIDAINLNTIIIEAIIPASIGGFYVNCVGIYTDNDELFALAKIPQTYKSKLADNIATDLIFNLYLQVGNADSINLTVDESTVLASKDYVKKEIITTQNNFNSSQELQDIRTTANEINTQKLISDLALEVSKLKTAVSLRGGVGMIYTFAGATENIPSNFMLCDGRELSKADYPQLFNAIGTIYGESADTLSFKIPDLRGCFTRCVGGNADALGIKQGDAIRNIEDTFIYWDYHLGATKTELFSKKYVSWATYIGSGEHKILNVNLNFDASRVVPTANENRPLNMAMNYVIQVSE